MPLMRAICRMETGEPLEELADRADVVECIGGRQAIEMLPTRQPDMSVMLAAVRTAKSQKAAAKAFRATQICDLSMLKDGEIARYSILSIDKDKADAVLDHLIGKTNASPIMKPAVLRETADGIMVLHPSGRVVEIKVMAGKRAGGSLVSRWSIGATFDEAPRMDGSDKVVNLPDALTSLHARLLPGAQIDLIGSPWAPRGPIYDMYVERYGRPGEDLVFMVGKGPDLNPVRFTPEFCEKLKKKPAAYRVDVEAKFADPESSLLSSLDVEACTRHAPEHLEPNDQPCVAAIDPANRRNAWTLVIARPKLDGSPEVVFAKQWMGSRSAPLKSSRVFAEIKPILALYRCGQDPQSAEEDGEFSELYSDQASFDDKHELAEQQHIRLVPDEFLESEWREHAKRLEKHVSEHSIELPPNAAMRADILGIQRRLTARSWNIELPKTGDGRHGDYAPALCLALKRLPSPVAQVDGYDQYDPWEQRILDKLRSHQSDPMKHAAESLGVMFQ